MFFHHVNIFLKGGPFKKCFDTGKVICYKKFKKRGTELRWGVNSCMSYYPFLK